MKIDLVADAFLNANPEEQEIPDAPDPFSKFVADAQLAGQLGRSGWQHVARLEEETAEPNEHFAKLDHGHRSNPWTAAKSASDLDEQLTDDTHRLEKMESASDRRKRNLAIWMRGEFALGKSASELINYAEQHDQATANLLREIAAELT